MARPLRIEFAGAVYHVTSRGNGRQRISLDDQDNRKFLELLGKTIERSHWTCHAFCLMVNHYHLMIETPEANLSRGMHHLNASYCQAHNKRHDTVVASYTTHGYEQKDIATFLGMHYTTVCRVIRYHDAKR